MDQVPNRVQAPNGIQTPNGIPAPNSHWFQAPSGVQAPNAAYILNQLQTPTAAPARVENPEIPRTPLGEPLDPISAALLAADPVTWHLKYFLSLGVIGLLRREDPALMGLRLDIEKFRMAEGEIKENVLAGWAQFQTEHEAEYRRYFMQEPEPTEEIKRYFRDLERMLVDKDRKARQHIGYVEIAMINMLHDAKIDQAREVFEQVAEYYPKLKEEAAKDAEASNRLPNGVSGRGDQSSDSEVEDEDSDEEMSDEDESEAD